MELKKLHINEYAPLSRMFEEEVKPSEESMYVWEHNGKTYIVAYFEGCVYDLMELIA